MKAEWNKTFEELENELYKVLEERNKFADKLWEMEREAENKNLCKQLISKIKRWFCYEKTN